MNDDDIIFAAINNKSMLAASRALGIHYLTFRKNAQRLGVFKTNQGSKGQTKIRSCIPLSEVLAGMHPFYSLRKKHLIKAGLKEHQCESCLLTEWKGQPIYLEIDHINGISTDHRYENLRILCLNCHAQTSTFRGKNRRSGRHSLYAKRTTNKSCTPPVGPV